MRLIDADALMEKEHSWLRDGDVLWSIPPSHIDLAPTIDAEPVVRCRDCKHYQHYGKTSLLENGKNVKAGWCYRRIRFDEECRMPADGFCSYGQRKEDDHD